MQWRWIAGFLGRKAVAYDIPRPDGGIRATLYVVKLSVADLGTCPPLHPARNTGGYCTAAWQEGRLLYVLVVHDRPEVYRRLLNQPRWPLT